MWLIIFLGLSRLKWSNIFVVTKYIFHIKMTTYSNAYLMSLFNFSAETMNCIQ